MSKFPYEGAFFSDVHIFKANSIYLNKIYAEKEKKRKVKEHSNIFWTAIDVENIMKPLRKEESFEKKSNSSQYKSHSISHSRKSSINSNNYIENKTSNEKNKKNLKKAKSKKIKIEKNDKNDNKNNNKKKKNTSKSGECVEDLSDLFNDKKKNDLQKNKINEKEKENSFCLLNKTIDTFEKTLQDFFEEKKEKKITKSSSSKSLENLKNLQKSLSQIEQDMDSKLKILHAKKSTAEILAENIEKQQIFTTNDDIYEISFQQKN